MHARSSQHALLELAVDRVLGDVDKEGEGVRPECVGALRRRQCAHLLTEHHGLGADRKQVQVHFSDRPALVRLPLDSQRVVQGEQVALVLVAHFLEALSEQLDQRLGVIGFAGLER